MLSLDLGKEHLMSLPAQYALVVYRGDSARWQFRLWADAGKTQPVDLTGVVAASEIRRNLGSAPVVTLTCSIASNVITVSLASLSSQALPAVAYWDLQLTYASGDVQTVVTGTVHVSGDVTASTAAHTEATHV